ncbi:hypothetical protein RB195_014030 [Necator americanus]|uniref:Uncharacterized protein n=1 Tax=Necator americanus TaxID=51031 RepID=A0ABR1DYP2_NECAM
MIVSASRINFNAVINMLIPLLLDPKRRVRLAAFEQLSVVAYLMNSKVETLLRAVRDTEVRHSAKGLTSAARIRRQTLPRIRYDGLIEYSTPPATDSSFAVSDSELGNEDNLDLNWILHAGEMSHTRPMSPLSIMAGMTKAYVNLKHDKSFPWASEKEVAATCSVTMDRMKSDDLIIRRQEPSGERIVILFKS